MPCDVYNVPASNLRHDIEGISVIVIGFLAIVESILTVSVAVGSGVQSRAYERYAVHVDVLTVSRIEFNESVDRL